MRFGRGWVVAAAVAAAGCGATGDPQPGADTFQAYEEVGAAMSEAVVAYAAEAADMPDTATCERVHAGYDGEMARLRERMRDGCGELDGCEGAGDRLRDQERLRDASCVADAIEAELGVHARDACSSGDPARDEEEAARHVRTMAALMEHQRVRLHEAACADDGTGTSGCTFVCERTMDGGFHFDGAPWSPGTVPPGGTPDPAAPWPHPCGDGTCDGSCHSP
jgi:hypothetical protein